MTNYLSATGGNGPNDRPSERGPVLIGHGVGVDALEFPSRPSSVRRLLPSRPFSSQRRLERRNPIHPPQGRKSDAAQLAALAPHRS